MRPPEVPEAIAWLARVVHEHGGRAYLVGGCIRDHLLGLPLKDHDVEVFGLAVEDLIPILRRKGGVNTVGRSFGVLKWRPRRSHDDDDPEIDVSVPRRDSKVGPGHKGIAVEGDPDMTVEEAARRRDLTINAMMWDVFDGRLVDPRGGAADLAARRLRAVDAETFLEDPLRALRVVQFTARLEFTADDDLVALCRRAHLDELPAERIQGEWGKLLLKGSRPSLGLALARRADILARVFPEVADLDTDAIVDRLAADHRAPLPSVGHRWALMLAGWLSAADPAAITAILDRLWIHTVHGFAVRDRTLDLVAHCRDDLGTDAALRHASTAAPLRLLLPLAAVVRGLDLPAAWARGDALGILDAPPPRLLLGRHLQALGMAAGPQMGVILKAVYQAQLDGTITTHDAAAAMAQALDTP